MKRFYKTLRLRSYLIPYSNPYLKAAPNERGPAEEEEVVYDPVALEELHGTAEGQESPPQCWDEDDEVSGACTK